MKLLSDALENRASYPIQLTAPNIPGSVGWQSGMVWNGYPPGVLGSPDQAMRLSAVFACLRLIAEGISTFPLDTFYRSGGIPRPFRPRPAYLDFPEPGLSKIEFLSQVLLSLLTDGNAYVLTVRDPMGEIIALWVLDPTVMSVERIQGKLHYKINGVALDPMLEVRHIKGMTLPGSVTGVSPIRYAMETVGVGIAAQEYGQSFFENGANPSGVITAPGDFKSDAADRFGEWWNERHRGVANANKIGVLTNGAMFNKVSIAPDEAQFIQTRQFTVPDVARFYGVPPHLIADASNSTSWGSGLAEQNTAFATYTLRAWVERLEEAFGRLLKLDGLQTVYVKLNMDAVLRPTLKERYDAAAVGIQNEFLTPNEFRASEDMAPVPWGDVPPPTVRREAVGPQDSNVNPATGKPVVEAPPTPAALGR